MLVVDASAVVEWLLGRPAGRFVEGAFREHAFDLHAPHLLDVEVVSALRRSPAAPDRAAEALADLAGLPVERYGHAALVPLMWALRDNFSAYDAAYVALAEAVAEGATLLTADARLARAAGAHTSVAVALAT